MYLLYAEGIWKVYILVADLEELEEMDASEIHAMVILPEMGEEFTFSVADGKVKPFGGDQALNTSILIRNQPTRGESHHDFLGESEGSPPPLPQDSYPDAGEARNDFRSISGDFTYRHHVEPRVKLYTPREKNHFLFR